MLRPGLLGDRLHRRDDSRRALFLGKNSFIPAMVIHAPALPFAVIFSARRSVDPFLHQILSRDGMQSLEKAPNTHRKTAGVPSPEHSAGANQERHATCQAHDQCRRELSLGHPCGQVPS